MIRSFGLYLLLGLAIATLGFAYFLIEPAPPKDIRIAAGSRYGAYYPIAQRLAERMRPHGVRVEVLETHGAAHNLSLMTGDAPPEMALIQGGTRPPQGRDTSMLRTLASVDLEGVWIIARPGSTVSSLRDLSGLAVAAGEKGSGTIDLFETLLQASGQRLPARTIFASHNEAVRALRSNQADLIFSVSPANNPWLDGLVRGTDVKFLELAETEALTRRFPFLSTITLPRASLDIAGGIPVRDIRLLATATNLVSSSEVHTATKMLALQALQEIDHGTLLLDTDGLFPNLKHAEYAVDPEAKRFFSSGPPFIRRYLPYWIANLIERFYAFLFPILTLCLPLFRLVPSWIQRRRREMTNRWYQRLAEVERTIAHASEDEAELQRHSKDIDRLEGQLEQLRRQISDPREYFSLRFHVDRVRRQLWRKLIAGWLASGEKLEDKQAGKAAPINGDTYQALIKEIERDLDLFAKLESRFEKTAIPGELFGDILDVKRGLRQARERLLALDVTLTEQQTQAPAGGDNARPSGRPTISLVSDRTASQHKSARTDQDDM